MSELTYQHPDNYFFESQVPGLENRTNSNWGLNESFLEEILSPLNPKGIILMSVYIPMIVVSFFGNLLVIIILSRYQPFRGINTYLLINLSVSDLLVTLICMPTALVKALYSFWIYGEFMCKFTSFLTGVSMGSSIFSIAALSIERYLSIRGTGRTAGPVLSKGKFAFPIILLWSLALGIQIPILIIRRVDGFRVEKSEFLFCIEDWPSDFYRKVFGILSFTLLYAIPGLIIIIAYSMMGIKLWSNKAHTNSNLSNKEESTDSNTIRSLCNLESDLARGKRKIQSESHRIVKLLMVLALVFALCFLPYSILSLLLDLEPSQKKMEKSLRGDLETQVDVDGDPQPEQNNTHNLMNYLQFAILLGHFNSVINPFLYCLLSRNFRQCLCKFLSNSLRFLRNKNQNVPHPSSSTMDEYNWHQHHKRRVHGCQTREVFHLKTKSKDRFLIVSIAPSPEEENSEEIDEILPKNDKENSQNSLTVYNHQPGSGGNASTSTHNTVNCTNKVKSTVKRKKSVPQKGTKSHKKKKLFVTKNQSSLSVVGQVGLGNEINKKSKDQQNNTTNQCDPHPLYYLPVPKDTQYPLFSSKPLYSRYTINR